MGGAVGISIAIALAGCGGGSDGQMRPSSSPSETLDTHQLERELRRQLESQSRVRVRRVDCPTGVELEAGRSFDCLAEDRSDATYTITVT